MKKTLSKSSFEGELPHKQGNTIFIMEPRQICKPAITAKGISPVPHSLSNIPFFRFWKANIAKCTMERTTVCCKTYLVAVGYQYTTHGMFRIQNRHHTILPITERENFWDQLYLQDWSAAQEFEYPKQTMLF